MLLLLCMFTVPEKEKMLYELLMNVKCMILLSLCHSHWFHLPPTPMFHPNFLPPFPFLLSVLMSDPDVSSMPYKSSHWFTR